MNEYTFDVIVVGSGAGGMTAAITAKKQGLSVLVLEKSQYYGGSTAMSGGGIWAPNCSTLKQAGLKDSIEEATEYMQSLTNGSVNDVRIKQYINAIPALFDMLEDTSNTMKFQWSKGYSDYHAELPGGKTEGRSIEAKPFNLRKLGSERKNIQPSDINIPFGLWLTASEFHDLGMVMRTWAGKRMGVVLVWRVLGNIFTRRNVVALGQSLTGRLRKVMQELDIPIWLNSPVADLVITEGRTTGVIAQKNKKPVEIRATYGVIIAAGGFDHNQAMRTTYLPKLAANDHSAGSPSNTGDGIRAAAKVGSSLKFMDDAWWMPSIQLPNNKLFTLVSERAIPRSIIVGSDGKRFTNEASPYVNFVHAQIKAGHQEVWQIIDATARRRYMYGGQPPLLPLPKSWYRTGTVFKAKTLDQLASKINIPAATLKKQIADYNHHAKHGNDPQYQKGANAYDHYYGDPTLKNPVVDTIDSAPYYAFRIVMGDLGTKGGIATNEYAQALDKDKNAIPGLYATGNSSASVMGNDYAGAGATISPSMVFGYVAAKHIAANKQ